MAIRPRFGVVLNEVKDLKIAALPTGARNDAKSVFSSLPTVFLFVLQFALCILHFAMRHQPPPLFETFTDAGRSSFPFSW